MASIFGQALKAIRDDPSAATAPPASLAEYEGLYESDWGETFVLRWDGSLAAVSLPTSDPSVALQKLRRDDGDVFRRVRDDGDLGEEYVFHRSDDGRVERFDVHGNYSRKVR